MRWPGSRPGSSSPRCRSSRSCWTRSEPCPSGRYAVIVDEAHSSQTGEAAKDLRLALGGTDEQELTAAEAEDAGFIAEAIDPVEEALAKAVGARGRQPNLSFFAFTATPKARTLEMFGI